MGRNVTGQRKQIGEWGTSRARTVLRLMTHHVDYLRRTARQNDSCMSKVFGDIIENLTVVDRPTKNNPVQSPLSVTISIEHLAAIDGLAVRLGISRSDVARRLIESVQAKG